MACSRNNWAIVGGGILGMTLAHRLIATGKRVTLIESAETLGGLAAAWQLGDVVWDRHYHVTLSSDSRLRGLLADLDLEKEMRWVHTRTGFYSGGRFHSMSNALEFLAFPPLNLFEKARLAATILYASRVKDWRRLEKVAVEKWLRRWSGRGTTEKIWLPLLRAKLGDNYKYASAAFIWSVIARMYAARRSGLKREMFGYVPGGYARILDRFGERLRRDGVSIRLSCPVASVSRESSGRMRVCFRDGTSETFDAVAVTAPAPVSVALSPQLNAEEKEKWLSIRYQGVLCASLLLREPLSGFYITNITDSWAPFTGVIEASALVDRGHFRGHSLVYLPKYLPSEDAMFNSPDGRIEEIFVDALSRMYAHFRRSDVLCFRVSRVRWVMPIPTLRYSESLPSIRTSVEGLYIVSSAHIVNGTLNVNETVQLAEQTADALVRGEA